MPREVLLASLRAMSATGLDPLPALAEAGDPPAEPARPSTEQLAVLGWVEAAWQTWERDFPLDPVLAETVRRLKPLVAALALTDPDCLVPGRHPVHQLLDTLQASAIGWQASLGRAGQGLAQQVGTAVECALAWFDKPDTDLAAIGARLKAGAVRDGARAQRMARRAIEAEQGQQKKAAAAVTAAQMINDALGSFKAPEEVGEFLKGPWYASACLVLLKFGADSPEWRGVIETTHTLLDSVQSVQADEGDRRQHLFRVVTRLPRELRRWLLSLHHDSDALDDAVGLVEFAHLCLLRRQPLHNISIEPIPLPAGVGTADERADDSAPDGVEAGQWYLLRTAGEAPLRARIIHRRQDTGEWLFSNAAGLAILHLDCREFARLLERGQALMLERGASFSRSLATVAGIVTDSDVRELAASAEPESLVAIPPGVAEDAVAAEGETEEQEQDRLRREWDEARRLQIEREQSR